MIHCESLHDLFGLGDDEMVSCIGAGGKTTLLRRLSLEAVRRDRSVLVTTTVKIKPLTPVSRFPVAIGPLSSPLLLHAGEHLKETGILVYAKSRAEKGKLAGGSEKDIATLRKSLEPDITVVEADGAAGRSLKFHASFEPPVPTMTSTMIVVIGADIFGARLNDRNVHRAGLFSEKLQVSAETAIDEEIILALLRHREGYLKTAKPAYKTFLYFSKCSGKKREDRITAMLPHLIALGVFRGIVGGDIPEEESCGEFFRYYPCSG
jgi:probable selenium-dependent hydroxylase accessory protein YqeC